MIKTLNILFFCVFVLQVFGQDMGGDTIKLKGITIQANDSTPVAFTHIHNESRRTSSISDTAGRFKIIISGNDSLVFSAVGYYPKLVILNQKLIADTILFVEMKERIYNIEEVSVFGVRTYQQLKQQVIKKELLKTQTEILRDTLVQLSKKVAKEAYEEAKTKKMLARESISQIPIASFPIYSKDEKERLKLKKIIEKEKIQQQVYEKFNKEIIAHLTGLKEPGLTDFFVYLDFSNKFVLKTSDYDIRKEIRRKFELYLEEKKQHGSLDTVIR